jgi:CRISPR-associated protein Cas1
MVNQYVFCPRFFHLAWVAGETGENDLTIDGKWIHRRVDEPTGQIGDPGSSFSKATSVTVSSERLGVIAKVDIVESRDGRVVPIELKRGRPKAPDHPVWRPERIQLATNALVLRDNGYRVDYGEGSLR